MPTQQHINWQRLIFWSFSYLSLVGSSVISYGNPVEPTVVRGAADFSNPAAGHLLIDQHTQRAVIDWPSFNIDAGELTEFRMPSSDSVSLNRVSGTGQSLIDGRLTSNGNLFLLNPNGVIIGQNSRIDVGGFVASSLNLDNDQFMAAGQLNFHGDSKAPVINLGRIGASTGDIILIAPQVTNEGSLMAPNGRVGLAAGNDVLLKVDGSERLFVRSASTKGGVINKGVIEANIAELKAHDGNVYGMAIQNEGRINAKSINREGGKIYLRSGSGKISNKGSLEAKGGDVRIDAGPAGEVEVAGTLDTTSDIARGGSITITGGTISLAADSLVIANGLFGGGEIKIGGGRRGQDPNLQNAVNVTVAEGATITANATLQGDGGNVVLFAEDALAFGGRISADGGLQGGDGGFIELSGQNEIFINQLIGKISLKAATGGKAGTLLIDPNDISIVMGGGLPIPGSPVNSNTIFDFDISDFLENTGSLIVETTGFGGSGNIDIDFMAFIFWTSSNSLTFNADGNFTNNGFIQSQSGAITVNTIGNGNITLGGSITSNASTVTLNAGGLGSITSMSGGFIGANAISLTAGSLGTLFNPLFLDTSDIVTNTSSQNGDQFLITGMNTALGAAGLNAGNGTIHLLGGDFYATGNERIADNSSLHIDGGSLYFSAITETLAAFSITGGNVDAGSANLNVSGPFSVTGAFFHGRDSTLNLEGDLTISSGFFASNSTVSLIGSSNQTLSGPGTLANLNIAKLGGDVVLANDYILGGGSLTGSGAIRGPGQLSIQGNQSIDFAGTIKELEFNQGANTTTLVQDLAVLNLTINNTGGIIGSGGPRNLNVSGNVFNADTNFSMANASLTLDGISDQLLSGPGSLANLNIAKISGDVVVQFGNFKLGGGSLTGSGAIRGPGRLEIVGNQSIDFSGTIDDLEFNQGATTTLIQDLNITDTLTITNAGAIDGSGGLRRLNVSGDILSNDSSFGMTNATFALTGERVNSFTATAGGNQGSLIIDKLTPSDVAFIGSNITFNSVTIDQGILDLNSRTLNSPVNVNAGGTLGGSGTVGNVIVAAGGTLSPGNSPGLINTGNLTFGSGGAFNADINGSTTAGVDFDRVNVTGSLNLGGATFSTFGNVGPGGSITIISNNGTDAVTDTFSGLAENAIVTINSNDFRINYAGGDGNDVVLFRQNVVPITPVIITTATNTTADTLNFPIGSPSTTVGGGGSNPPPTTVVTNNFSSTSGTGGSSGGTTSSPSISAVQLITQITTPTTITTTIATTELQPGTVVGEGTPSSGGGLATSNDSVAPATSVTASSTGSEPQKAVSLGGGPPASTQLQGEMTQSTNAESQNELRLSLGLPPGANVNSSEGSLDTGLGGAAPNRQTEAFLGSSVSDSSFVELAVAAGLNPAVSVQNSDGSGPMQLGAPPATQETSQALSDATSPAAEQGLSLALGGDGTAPTSAGDGTASVGIAVSQPRPETEVSLQSNISSGSASELSQALGGSGETTALPGSGPLTLDADGKPPSEQTTESLQTATSAQEESELFQSLGLAAGGVAQPTDGPLSTDFSDQKASPQTAQTLQTNTNEATRVELSDTIYEASIEAGAPVTDPQ